MGLFWDYFKKELRLQSIAETGPIAMVTEGASVCLDVVRDIMNVLREQFLPELCEDAHLICFARSRGIVRNPLEPEAHWLMRVRFAYNWWSRGGRASTMEQALLIGFDFGAVSVVNMNKPFRLYDEGTMELLDDEVTTNNILEGGSEYWAEFMVIVKLKGNAISYTREQIIWAINEIKPARSRLSALVLMAPLYDETTKNYFYDEASLARLTS